MKYFRFSTLAIAALSTVSLVSCYAEIHEHPDDDSSDVIWTDIDDGITDSNGDATSPTPTPEPPVNKLCRTQDCRKVPIYIVYTLAQNLGQDNTVVVEAFDNAHFEGAPQATASVSGFDASGAGSLSEGNLVLSPGKYYLRAFISNQSGVAAPYEYGGMKLISNKPVGYFGAASGAHSILVEEGSEATPPVTIKLNYLFKSNEKESPTDANLRILFNVAPNTSVESNRKLRIELRDNNDLATTPKATYSLPSDSLLVTGRIGKTEFVARNLLPGKYTIQAYVDSNDNEFPDVGELQQTWSSNGSTGYVNIVTSRTETITLQLQ